MVNVHALGGRVMMEAARAALAELPRPPLLIAVTVLTSMDRQQLSEIGLDLEPAVLVERLALLAKEKWHGWRGLLCSGGNRAKALCGQSFQLVTPGIRPADAVADDQSR